MTTPATPLPRQGGSFIRQDDGTLVPTKATPSKPASKAASKPPKKED